MGRVVLLHPAGGLVECAIRFGQRHAGGFYQVGHALFRVGHGQLGGDVARELHMLSLVVHHPFEEARRCRFLKGLGFQVPPMTPRIWRESVVPVGGEARRGPVGWLVVQGEANLKNAAQRDDAVEGAIIQRTAGNAEMQEVDAQILQSEEPARRVLVVHVHALQEGAFGQGRQCVEESGYIGIALLHHRHRREVGRVGRVVARQ